MSGSRYVQKCSGVIPNIDNIPSPCSDLLFKNCLKKKSSGAGFKGGSRATKNWPRDVPEWFHKILTRGRKWSLNGCKKALTKRWESARIWDRFRSMLGAKLERKMGTKIHWKNDGKLMWGWAPPGAPGLSRTWVPKRHPKDSKIGLNSVFHERCLMPPKTETKINHGPFWGCPWSICWVYVGRLLGLGGLKASWALRGKRSASRRSSRRPLPRFGF